MAKLGWASSIGRAVGAAAGAAAAQFGMGYGLGILSWAPDGPSGTPDDLWLASLAWTTFIAATSTVAGAIWADRRSASAAGAPPRRAAPDGTPVPPTTAATASWRTLMAFCAALGALLSVILVLIPARGAVRADTLSPEWIAVGYAIVGVVIGVLVAVCALSARAITLNVLATALWLWVLATASALDGVAADDGVRVAPLAIWPFGPGTYFRTSWSIAGMALMFGAALVLGVVTAWIAARRRTDGAVGIALSGAIGPLMVAAAYLLTAPRLVGVHANAQISAYLTAPYAVIAGLAGSVLVVVLYGHRDSRRAALASGAAGTTWSGAITSQPTAKAATPTGATSTPAPRSPADRATEGSSEPGGSSDEQTLQLPVGHDVPGRLPGPGEVPASAEPGAVATATVEQRPAPGPRPSPRRRPGRR
jgi:hypothetical protein